MGKVFDRYADPCILDDDADIALRSFHRHTDDPAGRRELDRVVQQVEEEPAQLAGIPADRTSVQAGTLQSEPARFGDDAHVLGGVGTRSFSGVRVGVSGISPRGAVRLGTRDRADRPADPARKAVWRDDGRRRRKTQVVVALALSARRSGKA